MQKIWGQHTNTSYRGAKEPLPTAGAGIQQWWIESRDFHSLAPLAQLSAHGDSYW